MKTKLLCSLLAGITTIGLVAIHSATAGNRSEPKSLLTVAHEATSKNQSQADAAIKTLRAAGADGLNALSEAYSDQLAEHVDPKRLKNSSSTDEAWERIRTAFDAVGEQRDCYASHLFWFTDLEQAKAAARSSGKPILSLRLLGKLDEEYSCANSRFFRTTLYANAEVSQYLRDHFILHWQSVRPVPRITIDMGDGRKIERTITGNSIHYVLDADGNPIDALPGLYSAKAFLAGLDHAVTAEQQAAKLSGNERAEFLKNYHSTQLAEIQTRWSQDLAKTGSPVITKVSTGGTPDAIAAVPRAISKSGVERPMFRAGAQSVLAADRSRLDAASTDESWRSLAALHFSEARLDMTAFLLVTSKQTQPTASEAMPLTASKSIVETPMMRAVHNLERSIAEDTVRNEYQMHSRIHEWFVNGTAPSKLDALNKKVYAELFLTPDSDPWLGLAPSDAYSALEHDGLVQTVSSR